MKRLMIFAFAILFVFAGSLVAQNRRHAPGPLAGGPGPGGPGLRGPDRGNANVLADYLSLTSEQKAAWESIQSETRAAMMALHDQERSLAEQLESATDASTIGSLVLQLRAIQTQLEAARKASEAKFTAILTSDQQVKFAAFQAATEFLQRRGPGGPPPPRQ